MKINKKKKKIEIIKIIIIKMFKINRLILFWDAILLLLSINSF